MVIGKLNREEIINHLQGIRTKEEISQDGIRQKLLRYYQHDYTETYVREYFKGTSLQQIPVFTTNFTKRVVDARSLVYKKPPEVIVDEKYIEYSSTLNSKRRLMERMTFLLGTSAMLTKPHPKWDEGQEELEYEIIPYFRVFFLAGTDAPCAIAYPMTNTAQKNQYAYPSTTWVVWTASVEGYQGEHFLYDGKDVIPPTEYGVTNEDLINPYGVLPVSFSYRMPRIGGEFWVPGASDVCKTNNQLDIAMTELALAYRFDAVGIKWIKGAEEITKIDSGVDKFILIPQEADIGRLGSATLNQLIESIRFITEQCLQNNMLSVKWADKGGQAKSGESLKMENIDNMEQRESNAEDIWRIWEKERFDIDRAILEILGTPINEEYRVNFTEPTAPMSMKEEREQWDWELGHGYKTDEDYLRWSNPDISDEEVAERLAAVETQSEPKPGGGSLLQSLAKPVTPPGAEA